MLDVPAERPVDPVICEILTLLNHELASEKIDYFLVGASARDLLMHHVFGIKSGRATRDVDFAVALASWEQFERMNARLLATGRFSKGRESQRLYFEMERNGYGYPVDLLPFGGIEKDDGQIAWPPDGKVVMNVIGYEEALRAAMAVQVTPHLTTTVVSLPAMAGLKLLAWKDRAETNSKDAQDLHFLLKNYTQAGNLNRLYAEALNLLTDCDHDPDLAGAALLGFDCRLIMGPAVVQNLMVILADRSLSDASIKMRLAFAQRSSRKQNASHPARILSCRH